MGYRQYTSCVEPTLYIDFLQPWRVPGPSFSAYLWFGAIIAALVAGLINAYNLYLLPILIGLAILIVLFLIWWLRGRLICLGGERCAIGVALGRPHSQPLQKAGDDDASMNVLLAPNPTATDPDAIDAIPKDDYTGGQQGYLTKEQDAVLQIGREYVSDTEHVRKYIKSLHCEFEGSGMRNVLAWASVVLALLIAALAVLLMVPPPFGPVISWLIMLLAGLITLIAGGAALIHPLNPGDPTDINPNLGMLAKGDIVIVKGDWIYDSLHTGWNEIHAIHDCQIIGHMDYDDNAFVPWPADLGGGFGLDTQVKVEQAVDHWCKALDEAHATEEGGTRDDPQHNWVIHPLIDGCTVPIIL
jgi:hypothetical protein